MMAHFVPVSVNQFVEQYVRNNEGADGSVVRASVEDALAAWRQGVRCPCGKPIWVAGSAVAGYGCFSCITGAAEPDGDPEIDEACDHFSIETVEYEASIARVAEIMEKHPLDYRAHLESEGFVWEDDDYDMLYEEEAKEERMAVPETENQRWLIHFFEMGGPVNQKILDAYMNERYSETANVPLIRKYFKKANTNLKILLFKGLAKHPTNPDLLDDFAYFSEFDNLLGDLIHLYTDACRQETDMERFSVLAQDFHMNTFGQGYDALHELSAMFPSGTKGYVIQHLVEAMEAPLDTEVISF